LSETNLAHHIKNPAVGHGGDLHSRTPQRLAVWHVDLRTVSILRGFWSSWPAEMDRLRTKLIKRGSGIVSISLSQSRSAYYRHPFLDDIICWTTSSAGTILDA
jgi:hypothetical protein